MEDVPDPAVHRRRRLVAGAVAAALALASATAGALTGAGGDGALPPSQAEAPEATPEPVALPRGGRSLFPEHRVVAYYGAPQDEGLGALGIGTPASAARRLERQAKAYARPDRPVLPALELIAVIANRDAGEDGMYRARQTDAVIGRYLRAAPQGEGAAAARHPARRLGLLHGGDPARALAARARRRPRARPRVAGRSRARCRAR